MRVILDTNVLVAAGFRPNSAAAAIVRKVEQGELSLVWDERTRRESQRIVTRIPPLSWERVARLFVEDGCFRGQTHPERFGIVPDPDDRKYAALAEATGAALVTNDGDLLDVRERLDVEVLTPSELLDALGTRADEPGLGWRR